MFKAHDPKRQSTKRIPEYVWALHKDTIEHMYLTADCSVEQVAELMREVSGFNATSVYAAAYTMPLTPFQARPICYQVQEMELRQEQARSRSARCSQEDARGSSCHFFRLSPHTLRRL